MALHRPKLGLGDLFMPRKQPFTFAQYKAIYSKVTRLTVDLVIKSNHGILLTLRQKNGWIGQWHLPGGTVLYQEAVENAVHRIAREELGTQVTISKFLGFLEYPSEERERGFGYTISLVFLCKPNSSKFQLDTEVSQAKYFKAVPSNTIQEQRHLFLHTRRLGFRGNPPDLGFGS